MNSLKDTFFYNEYVRKLGQNRTDEKCPPPIKIYEKRHDFQIKTDELVQLNTIIKARKTDPLFPRTQSILRDVVNNNSSKIFFITTRECRDPNKKYPHLLLPISVCTFNAKIDGDISTFIDLGSKGKFRRDAAKDIELFSIRDSILYGMIQMAVVTHQLQKVKDSLRSMRDFLISSAKSYMDLVLRVFHRNYGVTYRTSDVISSGRSLDVYNLLRYSFAYFFFSYMAKLSPEQAKEYANIASGRETAELMRNSDIKPETDLTFEKDGLLSLMKFLNENENFRSISRKYENGITALAVVNSFRDLYGEHVMFMLDHFLSFYIWVVSSYFKVNFNKDLVINQSLNDINVLTMLRHIAGTRS